MCDIHIHIVPGVDDGAIDTNMALSMMLHAYRQGISVMIATPHSSAFDYNAEEVWRQFRLLHSLEKQLLPEVQLCFGSEVYCEAGGMERVISALNTGKYPAMNGTNYVLAEFSQWVMPEQMIPCITALIAAGWRPILAHVERYDYLRGDMDLVDILKHMGCMFQVNIYSFSDETSESVRNWARCLARKRKVDFLGSDAHRTYYRPPDITPGLSWLYENLEKEYVDQITLENPQKLLNCEKREII